MPLPLPTDNEATQFAVMLQSGLPAGQAILYFTDSDDPGYVSSLSQRWVRSRAVGLALRQLMKKSWQEMTTEERMRYALDLHYNQLATLLFSQNYIEANPQDKIKMDEARKSLESKLAGTAGKMNALENFYSDLREGKIRLAPTAPALAN
jgi:hypothetical protein